MYSMLDKTCKKKAKQLFYNEIKHPINTLPHAHTFECCLWSIGCILNTVQVHWGVYNWSLESSESLENYCVCLCAVEVVQLFSMNQERHSKLARGLKELPSTWQEKLGFNSSW